VKKTVYIETSLPSYLTAQPSRDVRTAAWQQITCCPEICTPLELLSEGSRDVHR
jgi:hypothetical protein